MPLKEILMEIQRFGGSVRVCAVDAETGTEVVFQAPARVGKAELRALAARKLAYVLSKSGSGQGGEG
jgi:hypothetical protein